jgi:hypothetical protein
VHVRILLEHTGFKRRGIAVLLRTMTTIAGIIPESNCLISDGGDLKEILDNVSLSISHTYVMLAVRRLHQMNDRSSATHC